MRIAFMGTPPFAVPTLAALHAAGHDVAAVYSQPPRPAQRGKKLQKSPVQVWAEEHGLPVRTPRSLKSEEAQAEFAALNLDVAVVAGKLTDGNDESLGFNAATDTYENLVAAGVIDPTKVVRTALQNAASVAGLLITTEAAISDIPEDKSGGGMPDMGGMGGGMGGMGF